MKMYLISDNIDTYTGMRLAGVEGVVVHERDRAPGSPGAHYCRQGNRDHSPYRKIWKRIPGDH